MRITAEPDADIENKRRSRFLVHPHDFALAKNPSNSSFVRLNLYFVIFLLTLREENHCSAKTSLRESLGAVPMKGVNLIHTLVVEVEAADTRLLRKPSGVVARWIRQGDEG